MSEPPLAVDLDGTLFRGDVFFEAILSFIGAQAWRAFELAGWLMRGRAYAKARLAEIAPPQPDVLPYDRRVVEWLRAERARGRVVALATASDRKAAQAIADHVGAFDAVFASDGATNLKSARKAEALTQAYPQGFVYAGNEYADLKVWRAATAAVLVNASAGLTRQAQAQFKIERSFPPLAKPWRALLTAMRPPHWAKNALVFAPLLAVQRWSEAGQAVWAFAALCCAASAAYLFNDAFDMAADRRDPRKRARAFASGELAPAWGLAAASGLSAVALALAAQAHVAALLGCYLGLAALYTLGLKRVGGMLARAVFYALRVLIGAAAIGLWPAH